MALETIEVLYALTDKKGTYSKFAGTSICSLFENTKEKVRVHIFHDGSIGGDNKENFIKLAAAYGQEILFYNVRQLLAEVWQEAEKIKAASVKDYRYTEAALYRLLAPQILPGEIGRLIYIDVDTVVHIDIKKLWQENIGPNGMSAVFEEDSLEHYGRVITSIKDSAIKLRKYWETQGVKVEATFNSGVLLMDLHKIRSMGNLLLDGLRVALDCEEINNCHDQNILNFYFAREAGHLPWHYNMLQLWDRSYKPSREVEGIYHYMGRTLSLDENDLRDTIFYDYFIKTPWLKGKTICHIFNETETGCMRHMERKFVCMRQLIANLAAKKLVLAASLEKEAEVLRLCQSPKSFKLAVTHPLNPMGIVMPAALIAPEERDKVEAPKSKADIKRSVFPADVEYLFLGSDDSLKLNLPYDVDSYFYLFFVEDYITLKVMLEQAGLEEEGHFMNGDFLIEEVIEGGLANPNVLINKL